MANKTIGLYANNESYQPHEDDQMIVEAGVNHIAFLVKNRTGQVNAVEWFTIDSDERDNFETLFYDVKKESELLNKDYASNRLFINSEQIVLIPPAVFDHKTFNDYLNVALGEPFEHAQGFDEINGDKGFVNAYRFEPGLVDYLKTKFSFMSVKHSYSSFLLNMLSLKNMPANLLNVIFYEGSFVVTLFKEGKLQLMQSYLRQAPEDVLYYLLNITNTFKIDTAEVTVKISGFIETNSGLYSLLGKYFKNVSAETAHLGNINIEAEQHPLHYFIPLFNLAV